MLITLSIYIDVGQTSTFDYFFQVISLLSIAAIRIPLMEGLVSATGVGSDAILRASREALFAYLEQSSPLRLVTVCEAFISLLQTHMENDRLLVPILEVLGFLLDMNVFDNVIGKELR
jgi:hypothetical protein